MSTDEPNWRRVVSRIAGCLLSVCYVSWLLAVVLVIKSREGVVGCRPVVKAAVASNPTTKTMGINVKR